MKAQDALAQFKASAEAKGKEIACLSPREAIDLMVDFYSAIRAEDCDLDADGDMLLLQWGVYDWGEGEMFEYNITRQFIFPMVFEEDGEKWEEDSMWQLSLTCKSPPSEAMRNLDSNDKWCSSPDEVSEFLKFIGECAATRLSEDAKVTSVELTFEQQ